MKTLMIVLLACLALAGAGYTLLAPSGASEWGAGVPPGAVATPIRDVLANPERMRGREITVRGRLHEVCPTTGCWGVVNDGTGAIRVDTSDSGWALSAGQRGREIVVRGPVALSEGGAPEIAATGARM